MFETRATKSPFVQAADLGNAAIDLYYGWVRQMLSLCVAALTALVVFQGNYTSGSDLPRYLLCLTFVSLGASVVASAVALRGHAEEQFSLAQSIAREALQNTSSECSNLEVHVGHLRWLISFAKSAQPWFLAISVLLLCAFGITNSIVK
jgi:hypothetical protein